MSFGKLARHLLPPSPVPAFPSLRIAALAACLSAGSLAFSSDALAQQWFFTPVVEIGVQHEDNPRLEESGDSDSITGGLLDLGAALHRNTQTSTIVLNPSAEIYRYSGDSNENSEAFFFDMDAENRGQRSNWRFRGNFRNQQVLRGEITSPELDDDIGIDDSVQTGTGRTFVRRERNMLRLGPGFTFDLTERTSFRTDINYLDVGYDTEAVGEAIDYTNSRVDAAILRSLTPDSSVEVGVFASKYEPDALSRETDSLGARVRYEKEVTDISSFFVDVGAQEADIQSTIGTQDDVSETSFLWNVGYSRQWERTQWRFDVGQAVTPTGSGVMVERDLYRAMMQHQLRPRWSMSFSAVLLNTDALGEEDLITSSDRDYLKARATLGYQMTRTWTIQGQYNFTHQDFADLPGDAQENEIRLSLIYRRPVPTS